MEPISSAADAVAELEAAVGNRESGGPSAAGASAEVLPAEVPAVSGGAPPFATVAMPERGFEPSTEAPEPGVPAAPIPSEPPRPQREESESGNADHSVAAEAALPAAAAEELAVPMPHSYSFSHADRATQEHDAPESAQPKPAPLADGSTPASFGMPPLAPEPSNSAVLPNAEWIDEPPVAAIPEPGEASQDGWRGTESYPAPDAKRDPAAASSPSPFGQPDLYRFEQTAAEQAGAHFAEPLRVPEGPFAPAIPSANRAAAAPEQTAPFYSETPPEPEPDPQPGPVSPFGSAEPRSASPHSTAFAPPAGRDAPHPPVPSFEEEAAAAPPYTQREQIEEDRVLHSAPHVALSAIKPPHQQTVPAPEPSALSPFAREQMREKPLPPPPHDDEPIERTAGLPPIAMERPPAPPESRAGVSEEVRRTLQSASYPGHARQGQVPPPAAPPAAPDPSEPPAVSPFSFAPLPTVESGHKSPEPAPAGSSDAAPAAVELAPQGEFDPQDAPAARTPQSPSPFGAPLPTEPPRQAGTPAPSREAAAPRLAPAAHLPSRDASPAPGTAPSFTPPRLSGSPFSQQFARPELRSEPQPPPEPSPAQTGPRGQSPAPSPFTQLPTPPPQEAPRSIPGGRLPPPPAPTIVPTPFSAAPAPHQSPMPQPPSTPAPAPAPPPPSPFMLADGHAQPPPGGPPPQGSVAPFPMGSFAPPRPPQPQPAPPAAAPASQSEFGGEPTRPGQRSPLPAGVQVQTPERPTPLRNLLRGLTVPKE